MSAFALQIARLEGSLHLSRSVKLGRALSPDRHCERQGDLQGSGIVRTGQGSVNEQ